MRALLQFWRWLLSFARRPEEDEYVVKIQALHEAREREHKERITKARHHLTGTSWRDSAGKEEFVQEVYQDQVPMYLWYALGDRGPLMGDYPLVREFFWEGGYHGPGDIELHHSGLKDVGMTLRISHPKKFTASLMIGDRICPLYQVGDRDIFGESGPQPCVLFLDLYEETTKAPHN